jgi:hypothetical protein
MLRSFSEFSHRVQDQLKAMPPEVHRHPAYSLDLLACVFTFFNSYGEQENAIHSHTIICMVLWYCGLGSSPRNCVVDGICQFVHQ